MRAAQFLRPLVFISASQPSMYSAWLESSASETSHTDHSRLYKRVSGTTSSVCALPRILQGLCLMRF